jgi:glycosyltransferase involved in cell wall biosynthesis
MRVLLVTDWNRGLGGAEASIAWLRDGLRAAGDETCLLTSGAGTAGNGTADFVAFGTEHVVAQTFLQIENPLAYLTARRAVREFRPDVAWVNMFAHHLSPAVLRALRQVPTVLMVSDYKCVCPLGSKLLPDGSLCQSRAGWSCREAGCVSLPHWLRDQPRYALIRSELRHVTRVVAISRWVRRELAAAGITADVLLSPVPSPAPGFQRAPSTDPLFVFCGRLDREKGVALLLRAFARVYAETPQIRLRIVGQGPQRASLDNLARELGISSAVQFLGWMSTAQIENQLREAWASVVPSLWAEPLGLVATEAIVRGVPVIASVSGGLAEIVEHGVSGLLFPNNDEAALADALRSVASGRVFAERTLPSSVVHRVQEAFNLELYVQRVRGILAEVCRE